MNWRRPNTFKTLQEHCKYSYLMHTEGASYSARLKYIMLCSSAVILPRPWYSEFFYHMIEPWYHVVPVARNLKDLQGTLKYLLHRPALGRRIGKEGAAFVERILSPENIRCYYGAMLMTYAHVVRDRHNVSLVYNAG